MGHNTLSGRDSQELLPTACEVWNHSSELMLVLVAHRPSFLVHYQNIKMIKVEAEALVLRADYPLCLH